MHLLAEIAKPFIPGWNTPENGLRPFAAEMWLIGAIIAVLIVPFFSKRSNTLCAFVALAGLLIALVSTVMVGPTSGMHFRNLLVTDQFSYFWKLLLLVFTIGVVVMWFSTTASTMHEGDGPEFFTLLLSATIGMSLMAQTSNLLMLFMCVELASLPSYVLAGFRKTHRVGAEASLKYVLFGAATSAVMVYGLSLLYGLYGTLDVATIALAMPKTVEMGIGGSALLAVAVFGLIVGIGFKISAVPFHFWCPDVFEGASIDVTTFLSVASKGAALALLLRVLMTFAEALGYQNVPGVNLNAIAAVVGFIGAITSTVGNTAAFVQNNIKRLLAYSSISHAGYMMCALSLLVQHGSGSVRDNAAQAILLYLAVYMFMNLGAFTVAGLIQREIGSEDINDYAGMGRPAPFLAICLTLCLFSLVGLPPLAGFNAKVYVLWALIQNGGWWWWLVAAIGVNTVLSLYYYVRVIRVMYLTDSTAPAISANPLGVFVTGASAAMLLVMFFAFSRLDSFTKNHSQMHLNAQESAPVAVSTR